MHFCSQILYKSTYFGLISVYSFYLPKFSSRPALFSCSMCMASLYPARITYWKLSSRDFSGKHPQVWKLEIIDFLSYQSFPQCHLGSQWFSILNFSRDPDWHNDINMSLNAHFLNSHFELFASQLTTSDEQVDKFYEIAVVFFSSSFIFS